MKKLVFIAFIFLILFLSFPSKGVSQEGIDQDYQVIPDEAIRLRILANSDNDKDQALKQLVRDRVNEEVSGWVEHMTDINDARQLIEERIPEIDKMVGEVIEEEGFENDFSVEYGKNVEFPTKLYDSYLYPAGQYEAILITIGEGKGDNWWCVLFPPLCFLDFSFGSSVSAADASEAEELEAEETVEEQEEETEVKFFLFEWLGLS
ncbi:stage II sporulation protein R [Oceanobacillus halophilus]|uniref:Stage II sporulation protein R n=1 Tax=Oceanobacillus halophilus TaxID=930130 RepID=A0A495A4B6_9BACI|nr:stage II sporulation protein R [Oceanobacillus halophilus]RKQ34388.1 stage II sporulation protein R [Oceanobacillus halophilus]